MITKQYAKWMADVWNKNLRKQKEKEDEKRQEGERMSAYPIIDDVLRLVKENEGNHRRTGRTTKLAEHAQSIGAVFVVYDLVHEMAIRVDFPDLKVMTLDHYGRDEYLRGVRNMPKHVFDHYVVYRMLRDRLVDVHRIVEDKGIKLTPWVF